MRGGASRAGHDSVVITTLGIDDKAERDNLRPMGLNAELRE